MSAVDIRYLYRRQDTTGIWIEEHGPMEPGTADRLCEAYSIHGFNYTVGICTSEDGRTVVTEFPDNL